MNRISNSANTSGDDRWRETDDLVRMQRSERKLLLLMMLGRTNMLAYVSGSRSWSTMNSTKYNICYGKNSNFVVD